MTLLAPPPLARIPAPLPARRDDLRIEPFGNAGEHVVKDPRSGGFFLMGEQEHFLLLQLDGRADVDAVQDAFEHRFHEPLAEQDLATFVETARDQGILVGDPTLPPPPKPRQSLLFWRVKIFDPDRLFAAVEPYVRFLFTRWFAVLSAVTVVFAALVLWANAEELARSVYAALGWDTALLGWLVMFLLGILHECSHGLTCKHHGGEVREVGFLFLFFAPCLYCNVSDAWLFREKKKRIAVMLAGVWCDLVVWAAAVFLWRVTEPDTLIHRLAFVSLMVSGLDTLINLNPLIKLDGYYLLSDLVEVPNLRARALERAKGHVRRWLWGAPRPGPETKARLLSGFGLVSLAFSTVFLVCMVLLLGGWLYDAIGVLGWAVAVLIALPGLVELFHGVFGMEVGVMVTKRHIRTAVWLVVLGGIAATVCLVQVNRFAGGTFTVRPAVREEIRAPVAGFLRAVVVDEGQRVRAGDPLARLEVPDLDSRLDQKRAELREAEAQLRLLEAGTRSVEVEEQKLRVERAVRWHELARGDLDRTRKVLAEEMGALDAHVSEAGLRREHAESTLARYVSLRSRKAAADEQVEEAEQSLRIAKARILLAESERRVRDAKGTTEAEVELARRENELADERSKLTLLEAKARPEEIATHRARIERLASEALNLERLRERLEVRSSVAGVVVTPRLNERSGQYLKEGDLICVVEEPASQEAEIVLDEQRLDGVLVGQRVRLKARALPLDTIEGRVIEIAPAAVKEDANVRGTVRIRCTLDGPVSILRTSMSGHARIYTGRHAVGAAGVDWIIRLVRTEFW